MIPAFAVFVAFAGAAASAPSPLPGLLAVAPVAPPGAVEVAVAVPGADAAAVEGALAEAVRAEGLAPRPAPPLSLEEALALRRGPPADAGLLARISVHVEREGGAAAAAPRAYVVLVPPRADRALVRTFAAPAGADPVLRAQIAQVVADALDTLKLGGPVGVPLVEARAAARAPSGAVSSWGLAAGLFGQAVVSHPRAVGAGFGISAALRRARPGRGGLEPGLWVTAHHAPPATAETSPVAVRLAATGADVAATLGARPGPRWTLDLAFGGGIERRGARLAAGAQVAAARPRTDWLPTARAAARAALRLGGRLEAFAAAGLVASPWERRYVLLGAEEPQVVLRPWLLRPLLLAGVALTR